MDNVNHLIWLFLLGIMFFLFLRYDKNPGETGNGICSHERIKSYALGYMHARGKDNYKIKTVDWNNDNKTYHVRFTNEDFLIVYIDKNSQLRKK